MAKMAYYKLWVEIDDPPESLTDEDDIDEWECDQTNAIRASLRMIPGYVDHDFLDFIDE